MIAAASAFCSITRPKGRISDYLATGTSSANRSAEVSPIAHSRQTGVVQVAGQPPPSAMNSAAVSARRLASVFSQIIVADRQVWRALGTDKWFTLPALICFV